MKDWFPFTDYDFYACLTAGGLIVAVVDYGFFQSHLVGRAAWTIPQAISWIAVAYLVGQITAAPSSAIIEHLIARKLFRPPSAVLLGNARRKREMVITALFAQHEYRALGAEMMAAVKAAAAARLNCAPSSLSNEDVYQIAFPVARTVADTATRLDRFIGLYGFARNMCFAGLIASLIMLWVVAHQPSAQNWWLLATSVVGMLGMFGRYMKFYAAYGAEVLRTFARVSSDPK